jgi:hypothetical protein
MFGLNDNNTQTTDNNNATAIDAQAPMPSSSPFNDSALAAPAPQAVTPPAFSSQPIPDVPSLSTPPSSPTSGGDDLLNLKQQALHSLQPLVSHLVQSPEEKFKTTMMMIQATDDSALVKQAYESANQITDEKARAQALLDVVNEINYFTHAKNPADETKS